MAEFILKKMNEWEFLKLKNKRESLKFWIKRNKSKDTKRRGNKGKNRSKGAVKRCWNKESIKYFKSFKRKRRIRKYFFRL